MQFYSKHLTKSLDIYGFIHWVAQKEKQSDKNRQTCKKHYLILRMLGTMLFTCCREYHTVCMIHVAVESADEGA